jgi:ribosomal protein L18
MIKNVLTLAMLISLVTATTGYAASAVWGYGTNTEEAQVTALQIADEAASGTGTCVGGITDCIKDTGLYKCEAWVADYKKSCKDHARDFKKVVNNAANLLNF